MCEGYAAIQRGRGLPVEGVGTGLMTHSTGSVTTQATRVRFPAEANLLFGPPGCSLIG